MKLPYRVSIEQYTGHWWYAQFVCITKHCLYHCYTDLTTLLFPVWFSIPLIWLSHLDLNTSFSYNTYKKLYITAHIFSCLPSIIFLQKLIHFEATLLLKGARPSSPYTIQLDVLRFTCRIRLQKLKWSFSISHNFSNPQTSQQYNNIGVTKLSKSFNCRSGGKFNLRAFLKILYIAFVACSTSFFLATINRPL